MESTPALDAPIPHHEPASLIEALEDEPTEVAPLSLGQRLRQPRTILSIVVPLAIIGVLPVPQPRTPGRPSRSSSSRPTRRSSCSRFVVFYLGFPLRGYRWKRLLRETGFVIGAARLGRDPVPLVVRQLRRAGQARRRLPRLPAQDEQRRRRSAGRSGRSSSSASSTSSRSPSSAWPPASGASATGMPPAIRLVFIVGIVVVVVGRHRAVHDAQLRPPDPRPGCRCRRASSSCTSASRRASSAPSGSATCRSSRSSPG